MANKLTNFEEELLKLMRQSLQNQHTILRVLQECSDVNRYVSAQSCIDLSKRLGETKANLDWLDSILEMHRKALKDEFSKLMQGLNEG